MKSIFIAYDQAYQEKILFTLDHFNCRGFSMFFKSGSTEVFVLRTTVPLAEALASSL